MSTPQTIPELFSQWGTIAEFAADIGCGYEAARQMRRRESIDPKHWSSVVAAARKRGINGVSLQWLAKQRERRVAA